MRILFVILFVGFVSYSSAMAQFRRVELTKDEIIELYKIPMAMQPAYKFEWKFDVPTTCRVLVESRLKGDKDWIVLSSTDEAATTKAGLTVLFDLRPEARLPGDGFLLRMRWGFADDHVNGWGSRDVTLPGPVGKLLQWGSSQESTENICNLSSSTKDYRIRIAKTSK